MAVAAIDSIHTDSILHLLYFPYLSFYWFYIYTPIRFLGSYYGRHNLFHIRFFSFYPHHKTSF